MFSDAINFLIIARIAVDEIVAPEDPLTWLEKKYFSSKTPLGVCMYFWVVIREIVDSCISKELAISFKTRGFIASSPNAKNAL